MSWQNNFTYKQFSLNVFFNSIQGGNDGFLTGGNFVNGSFVTNTRTYFRDDNAIRNNDLVGLDYWSPSNPDGKYARVITGTRSKVEPTLYEKRNFIRLQDVTFSYELPSEILKKIKADRINFYVSGKNLLTFTKFDGWDPETGQGMITDGRPVLRGFTGGLMLTF